MQRGVFKKSVIGGADNILFFICLSRAHMVFHGFRNERHRFAESGRPLQRVKMFRSY